MRDSLNTKRMLLSKSSFSIGFLLCFWVGTETVCYFLLIALEPENGDNQKGFRTESVCTGQQFQRTVESGF